MLPCAPLAIFSKRRNVAVIGMIFQDVSEPHAFVGATQTERLLYQVGNTLYQARSNFLRRQSDLK